MNSRSPEQLWDQLTEEHLVSGEMGPLPDAHSPWFVRFMLGFAGWFGALFMLSFVGAAMAFIIRSSSASIIAGALICVVAAVIFRFSQEKDFVVQFGLATSFAGQALFIFGIMQIFKWENGFSYVCVTIFEVVLAAFVANEIHRAATAFAAAVSLSLVLWWYGVPYLAPALVTAAMAVVWMHEFAWADRGPIFRPIGYSLALAALYCNGVLIMHGYSWLLERRAISIPELARLSSWTGVLAIGAVFLYAVFRLLGREGLGIKERQAQAALIAAAAIAIVSYKAPGIATGLIIVLLGYANANRVLTGLGIFSLIVYLSLYYYQLQSTLLVKSGSLMITGSVLLVARFVLGRLWPAASQEGAGQDA
jgi:hypothetical protein